MDDSENNNIDKDAVAEFAKGESERTDNKKIEQKRDRRLLYFIVLAVCAVILAIQLPKVFNFNPQFTQPQRLGPTATDEQTDMCIHNLWEITKQLQLNELDISAHTCPLNGEAYLLTKKGDAYVVECPNAALHGFSHVRISTSNPIPELIP